MTNASRINRYFCWCSLICHLFPFHLLKALVINFNLVTLYVFGISINHAIVHKWKAVVLEDVTICKTFMVRQLIEPDIKHFFLGLISKPLIAYIIKKSCNNTFRYKSLRRLLLFPRTYISHSGNGLYFEHHEY